MRRSFLLLFAAITFLSAPAPTRGQEAPTKADPFGDPLPEGALRRIGTTRYRLPERIDLKTVRLSPDARHVAALYTHGTIDIWHVPGWFEGILLQPAPSERPETLRFTSFSFTADSTLAAFDSCHRLALFHPASGQCINLIDLPAEFQPAAASVALSPDRRTLVCAGSTNINKKTVHETLIWNLIDNTRRSIRIPLNGGSGAVHAVSPDCRWLAIGTSDDAKNLSIEFWDCATGKRAAQCDVGAPVDTMVFSADGKHLAVRFVTKPTIRIYDAATGKELQNMRQFDRRTGPFVFAPDGQALYVAEHEGDRVRRWHVATGEATGSFASPVGYSAQQFAFSKAGKPMAFAQVGQVVHYWEAESPAGVSRFPICAVHFSEQGELFVGTQGGGGSWWNARTGNQLNTLKLAGAAFDWTQHPLAMSVHGGVLKARYRRADAAPWLADARTGKQLHADAAPAHATLSLFARGQKAASMQHNVVSVWNIDNSVDRSKFDVQPWNDEETAVCLAISDNGRYFAVATDAKRLLLWDRDKRRMIETFDIHEACPETLCFSRDNEWLAFAEAKNRLCLFEIGPARSETHLKLPDDETIACLAFSPDGRQLACATRPVLANLRPGRLIIHEVASKLIRTELAGHGDARINCLAFAPDGSMLASGSDDTTVLLWRTGPRGGRFSAGKIDGDAAEAALTRMIGDDARDAFHAMMQLAQEPQLAVPLLRARFKPAPKLKGRTAASLIKDLGDQRFGVRDEATSALLALGFAAEKELHAAHDECKDLEVQLRIEDILAKLASGAVTFDKMIGQVRAVELAEVIATPEARALLRRWSEGEPGAVLTEHARRALERMR